MLADRLALGVGYALAGPAFAIVLLLLALLVQRFAPRPAAVGPRTASLAVRRVRDYPPRFAAQTAAAGSVALVVLLAATTAVAAPGSEGRAGRAVLRVCGGWMTVSSPWPGSYYSVPILVATGVCLALALIALRVVARRPQRASDDGSRRRAADVIVGAYGIAVFTPLAGSAFFASGRMFSLQCGEHGADTLLVVIASGGFIAGGVSLMFLAYMVSVLMFGRRTAS